MSRAKQKRMWTSVIQKRLYKGLKYEKKCDIKVWLWTLFGGGGIDVDEEKIMWIDNILIICNFIELFSNFFSLNVRYKKGCCLHIHTKGPSQFSLFFSFFFSLSQAYQNVLGVLKKCAPLFPSNFWVTPFLLYFCWTLCSMNMKLFSNHQNSKQIQINYFDNTYILCSNVNRADISSKL